MAWLLCIVAIVFVYFTLVLPNFVLTPKKICTSGGYATYLGGDAAPQSYTPNNLRQWLRFSADPRHTFNFSYLLLWGGQYLPAIYESQGWRWVTAGD